MASAPLAAIIAVAAGAAAGWIGWRQSPGEFYFAYLTAWLYWTGLSLGSLSLVLLHNLTGGKWGDLARPALLAAAGVLPITALGALPIVLQPERLYEWANESHVQHDPILLHKQPYLNVQFFQIRAAIYFVFWLSLLGMAAWQARSKPLAGSRADRRFRRLSGQGLALHGLAITFASVDWMMSLEPHWFSMIYGVIVFVSQGLFALAFAIAVVGIDTHRRPELAASRTAALHDLGNLMLGFIMFWAYVHFSQFLIIWYGNLPEEAVWYVRRLERPWLALALSLALLHFVVPFAALLSRACKRNATKLSVVALMIVVMHWIETVWMIEPAPHPEGTTTLAWLDIGLTAALGGIWWLAFWRLLARAGDGAYVTPVGEPRP
jgi:hypothetical protein